MADEPENGNGEGGNGNGDAPEGAGPIKEQLAKAMREAAQEVLGPVMKQGSQAASKYAAQQIPKIAKDMVMPGVMKTVGATNPGDIMEKGIGKVGETMSGAGGLKGMAGKVLKKLGGGKGKGGGTATGYGQNRRIMVQQDQHVPVNVKDAYRAWTQSEWTEFMHRVNTLDRQIEEDSARYAIGVKGLFFKKNFTAEIREQAPFKYIVWNTTQGNIKNTGRVSFHELTDDLTLMVLNLDLAPSGLREKMVRGFRFHKRGIRGDFHRFAAWVQHRTQDELDEMEGWLGTIKGGQITQTHEEYVDAHEEEQDRAAKREEAEGEEGQDENGESQDGEEEPQAESSEDEGEDEAEDEAEAPEDEDEDSDDDEADEDAGKDEDEEPEAEESDDADGYDEMSVAELRKELRDRDLAARGARRVLIDRLREDDEDEDDDEDEEEEPEQKPRGRQRATR
jgi:uncharacterized membrane protein